MTSTAHRSQAVRLLRSERLVLGLDSVRRKRSTVCCSLVCLLSGHSAEQRQWQRLTAVAGKDVGWKVLGLCSASFGLYRMSRPRSDLGVGESAGVMKDDARLKLGRLVVAISELPRWSRAYLLLATQMFRV